MLFYSIIIIHITLSPSPVSLEFPVKNIMTEHMRTTHAQKHYCKPCVNHLRIKIVLKQHRVPSNDENNTTVITVLAT